jgi:hypothetical protein
MRQVLEPIRRLGERSFDRAADRAHDRNNV